MATYVLTCSAIGNVYDVAPTSSGASTYVLTPASSMTSGQNVVATCQSAAWEPYQGLATFDEQDFLTLLPAIILLLVTAYGLKVLIKFTGGRR